MISLCCTEVEIRPALRDYKNFQAAQPGFGRSILGGLVRFSKPRFSAIICSLFVGSVLLAQTDTGRIIGTVVDQTGAVVAGAKVSLKNERTGEQRDVVSNESGLYFAT